MPWVTSASFGSPTSANAEACPSMFLNRTYQNRSRFLSLVAREFDIKRFGSPPDSRSVEGAKKQSAESRPGEAESRFVGGKTVARGGEIGSSTRGRESGPTGGKIGSYWRRNRVLLEAESGPTGGGIAARGSGRIYRGVNVPGRSAGSPSGRRRRGAGG
eukprot:1195139-Prorocentrum_minimum.AAC.4